MQEKREEHAAFSVMTESEDGLSCIATLAEVYEHARSLGGTFVGGGIARRYGEAMRCGFTWLIDDPADTDERLREVEEFVGGLRKLFPNVTFTVERGSDANE